MLWAQAARTCPCSSTHCRPQAFGAALTPALQRMDALVPRGTQIGCYPPHAPVPAWCCAEPHTVAAAASPPLPQGLTLSSKVILMAQPVCFSPWDAACSVSRRFLRGGDFLQLEPCENLPWGQAFALKGLASAPGRGWCHRFGEQKLSRCSECGALVSSPCQLSAPGLLQPHGSSLAAFFPFFFSSPVFSGTLYSMSIAGIPRGLLLSGEDAVFSARSCAVERLEEVHFATFLLGLLARVMRGAAVPRQACSSASAAPKGTAQSSQSTDLTCLTSACSPPYCRFAFCSP